MIELRNVSKIYKMGAISVPALKDATITIENGEFVAIMGPSGSGKSTLLNILGCLDMPTTGQYLLDGINIGEFSDSELAQIRNEKIGFIFQTFNLLPRLNAISNVELPLIYAGNRNKRKKIAVEALKAVNLEERAGHRPKELSGGQQQRVAIARALANEPSIILADEPTGNLDSKSGKEIIAILDNLHKKGITVILITHDDSIASYAKRIIRLMDGEIVEDRRSEEIQIVGGETNPTRSLKKKRKFSIAEMAESFTMAVSSIFANKLRSFLTMLGIIVGVAAVIAMTAIGQGAGAKVKERISELGTNLLMVRPGASQRGPARSAFGSITSLTYDDALAIAEQATSVGKVDASYSKNAQAVYGNKNTNTSINGATPNFPEVNNFPVEQGSFFTDEDNRLMRKVAVLGKTVAENLFEDKDPIGEYMKIKRVTFQVVGVLKEKGGSGWRDEDDVILVPLKTAQKRLFGVDYVSNINVKAKSEEVMDLASTEITSIIQERHDIGANDEDDFHIMSQAEILTTMEETNQTFTMLLAGIAVVSLIVGGIGIMNIMFVSVTERTREIGIRKAIGAQKIDILSQFLIEAIIVSLAGGAFGIIGGILTSQIMSKFAGWQTVITPISVVMSFSFALLVGLFFGFYPARKGALLNPIDALRYE